MIVQTEENRAMQPAEIRTQWISASLLIFPQFGHFDATVPENSADFASEGADIRKTLCAAPERGFARAVGL